MTNQAINNLKYANLQMAAEALYGLKTAGPGSITSANTINQDVLKEGNSRSSRFTEVQAEQFSKDWAVVEHISNTETGFSGTLFKCKQTDEARGLVKDELVISFRSTEFADDNVRDNKATNELEIKEFGWAFGQLNDMEDWYRKLRANGSITGPVTVTGYSLGGHLATAFNLLRLEYGQGGQVAGTYTFNGAGVGTFKDPVATPLSYVLGEFQGIRKTGADSLFTDTGAKALYNKFKTKLAGGVSPTDLEVQEVLVGSFNQESCPC